MFRRSFLKRYAVVANSKIVTDADLVVDETTTADGAQFTIAYRPEPALSIRGTYVHSNPQRVTVLCAPGHTFDREETVVELSNLAMTISSWGSRLDEDLRARPLWRAMEEKEADLRDLYDQVASLPDQYFTREEAADLAERLSELEAKLASQIDSAAVPAAEKASQRSKLHEDMDQLKEQSKVLRKSGWARSLATKSWGWLRDPQNRSLLKDGATLAKTLLLPPGPTDPS